MAKAVAHARVAVLGASTKEERYSFKAVHLLKECGYVPIPVHPAGHTVDGVAGVRSLADIDDPVDTLTLYVNARISQSLKELIIELHPRRVIFNPSAENERLAHELEQIGIEVVRACTLVMLRTNQF